MKDIELKLTPQEADWIFKALRVIDQHGIFCVPLLKKIEAAAKAALEKKETE